MRRHDRLAARRPGEGHQAPVLPAAGMQDGCTGTRETTSALTAGRLSRRWEDERVSNSRALRRRMAKTGQPKPRFPAKPPAVGTVRRWLNAGVADGAIERRVAERTGKPGRPPYEYRLTAAGKERGQADPRDFGEMLTELQARRAHALMKKGMSEKRAIAAVRKGWRHPGTAGG